MFSAGDRSHGYSKRGSKPFLDCCKFCDFCNTFYYRNDCNLFHFQDYYIYSCSWNCENDSSTMVPILRLTARTLAHHSSTPTTLSFFAFSYINIANTSTLCSCTSCNSTYPHLPSLITTHAIISATLISRTRQDEYRNRMENCSISGYRRCMIESL